MRFLVEPIAAIYQYYLSRNIDIPYVRTIMTVFGLLLILTFNFLIAFQLPYTVLFPSVKDIESRFQVWMNMFLVWTPIIILLAFLFSRKRLATQNVSESMVKKTGIVLFALFAVLLSTLLLLLVREGLRRGTI